MQETIFKFVLVITLIITTLSFLIRRARTSNWSLLWIMCPLFVLILPFVAWGAMILPDMLNGSTYREAMRSANQDGAIQILVTFIGKWSPALALLLCIPFGVKPTKSLNKYTPLETSP